MYKAWVRMCEDLPRCQKSGLSCRRRIDMWFGYASGTNVYDAVTCQILAAHRKTSKFWGGVMASYCKDSHSALAVIWSWKGVLYSKFSHLSPRLLIELVTACFRTLLRLLRLLRLDYSPINPASSVPGQSFRLDSFAGA